MLRVTVVTLFPELFEAFARTSLVGRAVDNRLLELNLHDLRPHGLGRHLAVDDTPYGGGSGMVLRVDCLVAAFEAGGAKHPAPPRRVLLTPQGQPFTQRTAERWSGLDDLMLVCGRYEGFDERVRSFVDEEASLGDFVMTGGEVAAMAMIEATIRLRPGVLGNETSTAEESFSSAQSGGLEYPQYTRPAEFRELAVPEVLKQGDHAKIAAWRREQAQMRTRVRRPELLSKKESV
ncbi:MAG TPA: tRNA (guanosine(37)-N1)-methyltransferase TrmD [Polyangiaceae bacterium]|jgi:tRNA (guanine37-N1)-methyltransferase|nr:tRNA (guanosine(37)-N1)-methyltransferase TrmD [Polyangiaceae bacterium]